MELEQWLKQHNIREMVMNDLKFYLSEYKNEEEEEFNKVFNNIILEKVKYEFHSVSYVINTWHSVEKEERKYISGKVRLEYEDIAFAEYEAIYDLDGNAEDDYFRVF